MSAFTLGKFFCLDGKQVQQQYKDHISDYRSWDQRAHAADWILHEQNCGSHLSIDETSLSNGELYTIVTNKAAKGGKGALVAMMKGTVADTIVEVLEKIPERRRNRVEEVTLDLAGAMKNAMRRAFPNASLVIDRFHVQQLAYDAMQELRIKYRWEALEAEAKAIEEARDRKETYVPETLYNGDSEKQLLARSRYLLFKSADAWTESQRIRAAILFDRYPVMKRGYDLGRKLGDIFSKSNSKEAAFKLWPCGTMKWRKAGWRALGEWPARCRHTTWRSSTSS